MKKKLFILPLLALAGALVSSSIIRTNFTNDELSKYGPDVLPIGGNETKSISGYCLLTFDTGESYFEEGQATLRRFQVRKGHTWKRVKNNQNMPTDEGTELHSLLPDKEFKGWYTPDNQKLFDNFIFNEDSVTITAHFGEVYEPTSFKNDDWEALIEVAERGYDALYDEYIKDQGEGPRLENDTFLITPKDSESGRKAKIRYVQITGLKNPHWQQEGYEDMKHEDDWPVRVIGINHDQLSGSDNMVAPLTFEFIDPINPAIGFDYTSTPGHNVWETSSLRQYLNAKVLPQIENGLEVSIAAVDKNTDDSRGEQKSLVTSDRLFIPSGSEVSTLKDTTYGIPKYDNSTYEYYRQDNLDFEKYIQKKNPYSGEPTTVWLRSPESIKDNIYTARNWYINTRYNEGAKSFIEAQLPTTAHAVCPCFAIGQQEVFSVKFTTGSTSRVELRGTNNFANTYAGYDGRLVSLVDSDYDIPLTTQGDITLTRTDGTSVTLVEKDDQHPTDYDYTYDARAGLIHIEPSVFKGLDGDKQTGTLSIRATLTLNKFKSDSWDKLISVANRGLHALHEEYGYDDEEFVGLTKYMTIGTKKYKTRIIGVGVDDLADGSGKAPLTFEFFNPLEEPIMYGDNNKDFPNSNANSFLKRYIFQGFLPEGIQKVKKRVSTFDETAQEWVLTEYDAQLFPLSPTELGEASEMQYFSEGEGLYDPDSGTYRGSYPFYRDGSNFKYLDISEKELIRYFYRSPCRDWDKDHRQYYGENLVFANDETSRRGASYVKSTDLYYISPAFAIGHEVNYSVINFGGEHYKINGEKPTTITNVEQGQPCTIDNITMDAVDGSTPTITKDDVKIYRADGVAFDNWSLEDGTTTNSYKIVINEFPKQDAFVTISSSAYPFTATSNGTVPINVSFNAGNVSYAFEKPSLVYSIDGAPYQEFDYDPFAAPTISQGQSISFKAAPGANNLGFGEFVNDADEPVIGTDVNAITFEGGNNGDPNADISISGNVMSLLGDGTTVPSTINQSYAFVGLFMGNQWFNCIKDASGLVLPAYGVDETSGATQVKGIYAYMFANQPKLEHAPAEIIGFNQYTSSNNVSHTYYHMFENDGLLENMPVCDFTEVNPYMCSHMFACCTSLHSANNIKTPTFATSYAKRSFSYMFYGDENITIAPNEIGSSSVNASESCCQSMFEGCRSIKISPKIICSQPSYASFETCFAGCYSLEKAIIDVKSIGSDGHEFYSCFNCWAVYSTGSLTSVILNSLELTQGWPIDSFTYWLDGQNLEGVIYCSHTVQNALNNATRSVSTLPESWSCANL